MLAVVACNFASARSPEQLGRIGAEDVAPDFAVEKLAGFARIHQSRAYQLLDVVRDRGLGYRELVPQALTRAAIFRGDGLEQRHAPRIGQRLRNELELPARDSKCLGCMHSSMIIELSNSVKGPPLTPHRKVPGLTWYVT